jgi:DNA invertase Pin-like site-specific DNA recombinase
MSSVQKSLFPQPVIAYVRRSSDNRQQYSLEAQKEYIKEFVGRNNLVVQVWFEETKSGKNMEREEWNKCIKLAKKSGTPIIVKSLSRLGRNASAVINTITEQKVIVADRGLECDRLTLNLLAVIDQNELERISERTKLGLQRAKAAGKKLGNPRPKAAAAKGRASIQKKADRFAQKMAPIIRPMIDTGMSQKGIADALNALEIPTQRDGSWTNTSVRRLLARLN